MLTISVVAAMCFTAALSSCGDKDKDSSSKTNDTPAVTAAADSITPATVGDRITVTPGSTGDVNGDGQLTIADAAIITQYLSNPDAFPLTDEQKKAADVVGDGDDLTAEDSLAIQNYISNSDSTLGE